MLIRNKYYGLSKIQGFANIKLGKILLCMMRRAAREDALLFHYFLTKVRCARLTKPGEVGAGDATGERTAGEQQAGIRLVRPTNSGGREPLVCPGPPARNAWIIPCQADAEGGSSSASESYNSPDGCQVSDFNCTKSVNFPVNHTNNDRANKVYQGAYSPGDDSKPSAKLWQWARQTDGGLSEYSPSRSAEQAARLAMIGHMRPSRVRPFYNDELSEYIAWKNSQIRDVGSSTPIEVFAENGKQLPKRVHQSSRTGEVSLQRRPVRGHARNSVPCSFPPRCGNTPREWNESDNNGSPMKKQSDPQQLWESDYMATPRAHAHGHEGAVGQHRRRWFQAGSVPAAGNAGASFPERTLREKTRRLKRGENFYVSKKYGR